MKIVVSLTWPWEFKNPEEIVQKVRSLNLDSIAVKATSGRYMYAVNAWTKARWKGKTNYDVELVAKAAGLETPIWSVVFLKDWAQEAEIIKQAVAYYNPPSLHIDFEGKTAAQNIANLGPFLRALGRLPCKVYLQSYRRAGFHPWVNWEKWFSYRDLKTGEHIIDGNGAQLYPITEEAKDSPERWIAQTKLDLQSHQAVAERVGRQDMEWFPTLPTFTGGGYEGVSIWKPDAERLQAQLETLKAELGERLVGINLWDLGGLFKRKGGLQSAQAWVRSIAADMPPDGPERPSPAKKQKVRVIYPAGTVEIVLQEAGNG